MNNLIVTVISIALAAALVLTGAYYGGQAYLEGQAKAQANQLIEGAKQVAVAWTMYATDHGGDYTLADNNWSDGTATDLVPKYLAVLPKYFFIDLAQWNAYGFPTPFSFAGSSYSLISSPSVGNTIGVSGITKSFCERLNYLANGNATVDANRWVGWEGGYVTAMSFLKPFYCAYAGPWNGNEDYIFLYRVS